MPNACGFLEIIPEIELVAILLTIKLRIYLHIYIYVLNMCVDTHQQNIVYNCTSDENYLVEMHKVR